MFNFINIKRLWYFTDKHIYCDKTQPRVFQEPHLRHLSHQISEHPSVLFALIDDFSAAARSSYHLIRSVQLKFINWDGYGVSREDNSRRADLVFHLPVWSEFTLAEFKRAYSAELGSVIVTAPVAFLSPQRGILHKAIRCEDQVVQLSVRSIVPQVNRALKAASRCVGCVITGLEPPWPMVIPELALISPLTNCQFRPSRLFRGSCVEQLAAQKHVERRRHTDL
jgi:hypothetical protein